ncbi:MAG: hypothetical protein COA52_03450 [Hyphomicrobiales bacterium]|nr:phage tail assembly chaperone [Hyphomicrobiales bacterium]PCJ95689.1 MAG: hypothetical protein COA52_03450 [Hyphomicrobiales bacterium]
MAMGLGVLRLSPKNFWQMTPRELAAACGPLLPAAPLNKSDLSSLIKRYPDTSAGAFS